LSEQEVYNEKTKYRAQRMKIPLSLWTNHVIQRYIIENVCKSNESSFISFHNMQVFCLYVDIFAAVDLATKSTQYR